MGVFEEGLSTTTIVDVKSIGFKKEEYTEIANGETGSSTISTCDVKSSALKAEGYTEIADCKTVSSGTELTDVKTISEEEEYSDIVTGEVGSSGNTSLDAKTASKGEEYTNIVNGETIPCATTTHDVKSTVSQNESNQVSETRKLTANEISNSQSVIEDMETASDVMHSGAAATIDVNSPESRKRKRQIAEDNKSTVGVILNPHDNIEDTEIANSGLRDTLSIERLPVQSHVSGGQQWDTNIARSLSEKLTIGSVEILKDHNLFASSLKGFADQHGMQSMRTHVAISRKKLLILDVNGLLADIICPPPKDCKSDINISRRAIFKRPFLDAFLGFCFDRFDVAIWSSRTKKILDPVVDYLLGDLKKKLLFLWDLSHCTSSRARSLENKHKCIVFKKLQKIWEEIGPNLASENGCYDESNTLLLDDSPYKGLLNPENTGIFPFSYSYKDINDNSLGPDGDLRVYLEGMAATDNVQKYVEHHPFGQCAIDETNPHWAFYEEVLKGAS